MEHARHARWRRTIVLAISIATAVGGAVGCLGPKTSAYGPVYLAPSSRPFEGDVPVPIGFEFVEHASEDASSGSRRLYLRHTYAGDADKISVRDFYREQMPLARWVKLTDGHVKGEYTLNYQKGAEACTVRIRDGRSARSVEVEVIITRQQGEALPSGSAR
jgi:hypothetical protein